MTATAETTGTNAALAPVAPGVLAAAKGTTWTVASLVGMLKLPDAPKLPEAEPFPEPAEAVTFTPALRKALSALPKVVGNVNPTTRRLLVDDELAQITAERNAINAVIKPLAKRADTISEIVRHHMDLYAEQAGAAVPASVIRKGELVRSATERIAEGAAKGHYLLGAPKAPYEVPVEGYDDCWQQRYVSGKPYQDPQALAGLAESGVITRAEFLAFTSATRSLNQGKITAFIARNPVRGMEILQAITKRGAPSGSLYAPSKPKQG